MKLEAFYNLIVIKKFTKVRTYEQKEDLMSSYANLFDRNLVFWNIHADSCTDLYQKIAHKLEDANVVETSYFKALTAREKEFPTGLNTQYLPIALPHANPENVKKAFIAVVKTTSQINMKQMGTNEDMESQYFFFLGIVKEKQDLQVKLLQRFMQLMNDESFVKSFKKLSKPEEVYEFLVNRF